MADSALWRRLDATGCDACRLSQQPNGHWRLEGMAVFLEGTPSALAYQVVCDDRWVTSSASISGWIGGSDLTIAVMRTGGSWTLNGMAVPGLEDCVDLDLGFTPATNLIALRRLALHVGETASAPAAWFDASAQRLERLEQRYERRSDDSYWYESPRFGYAALLSVADGGFVRTYPGLWALESLG